MNYLHYEVDLGDDEVVRVALDRRANVLLMDEANYQRYRSGQSYRYHGGLAQVSPAYLSAPTPGRWHVVIDLGGYPGTVRARVEVVRDAVTQGG